MKVLAVPGSILFAILFNSYGICAQVPRQPGQIALQTIAADPAFSSEPIRLSSSGQVPYASPLVTRPYHDPDRRPATIWKISIATMLAASAWDAASSMGKTEQNPLLRSSDGTFGMKGVVLKASLTGVALAPQIFLRNHKELRKLFTVANFVNTGIFAAVATHNIGIKAAPKQ